MTWLTLRQFRAQAAVVFAGLTVTGPGLADDYNSGLASCTAQDDCDGFAARFFSALAIFVVFLPASSASSGARRSSASSSAARCPPWRSPWPCSSPSRSRCRC